MAAPTIAAASLYTKSLEEIVKERPGALERRYGLMDLIAVSMGATLGSGVFTLVGQIAREDAGPAVVLSLLVSTFGVILTASAYVELSSRLPCSGSVYSYAYVGMGEVFAVIASGGLSLEYGMSAGAVAVNWGAKVGKLTHQDWLGGPQLQQPVAVAGVFLLVACGGVIIAGARESKMITRFGMQLSASIVLFMIICALSNFDSDNLEPFVKHGSGASGVLKGALSSFFGFLGFDECCCLSGVARDPTRTMPRAVILSVLGTASLTTLAAFALVGMEPSSRIDNDDGFVAAFRHHGWHWAAWISAAGELVALPVVVFACLLPQSHLFKEMADDGLLPPSFAAVSTRGVLMHGTFNIVAILAAVAAFVNFDLLNDMISAGALVSFIMASCSSVMVRGVAVGGSCHIGAPLACYVASMVVGSLALIGFIMPDSMMGMFLVSTAARIVAVVVGSLAGVSALASFTFLAFRVPGRHELSSATNFVTPAGPAIPCLSILFNSVMLATLSRQGCYMVCLFFAIMLAVYYGYGRRKAAAVRQLIASQRLSLAAAGREVAIPDGDVALGGARVARAGQS